MQKTYTWMLNPEFNWFTWIEVPHFCCNHFVGADPLSKISTQKHPKCIDHPDLRCQKYGSWSPMSHCPNVPVCASPPIPAPPRPWIIGIYGSPTYLGKCWNNSPSWHSRCWQSHDKQGQVWVKVCSILQSLFHICVCWWMWRILFLWDMRIGSTSWVESNSWMNLMKYAEWHAKASV